MAVKPLAAERRHQRRMDIDHAAGEIVGNRHPLEKPGHGDQIDLRSAAMVEDRAAEVVLRGERLALDDGARECRHRRRIAVPARSGCSKPPARSRPAACPAAIFSMKLRSVVPPPEIRTAMRKDA